MAFGNENCEYVGFSCGEQPKVAGTSFERKDPHAHVGGLIGLDSKRTRPIDPAIGNRIGLTIRVTGDTAGVSEALEATLKRHGVPSKKTTWEDKGTDIKEITFHDIPASQLSNLEKAVAEIELEHSTQRSAASR